MSAKIQNETNSIANSAVNSANDFLRYLDGLQKLKLIAKEAGYEVEIQRQEGNSIFSSLEVATQENILFCVDSFNHICASATEQGLKLRDEHHGPAWHAIRAMGLKPLSDVFSFITGDHVVEIYDSVGRQLYRSFNFLPCLSYTLDEVYTHGWNELYERDAKLTELYLKTINSLLADVTPRNYIKPFPVHSVTERFSRRRNSAEIEPILLSPLLDHQKRVRGMLHVFKILSVVSKA